MIEKNQESFREEADDLLGDLESSLLELEENPEDADLIGRVFRDLHTVKGLAGMAGFHEVSAFSHKVESVFDRVRSGEIGVTPQLVTLSLAALDRLRDMLNDLEEGGCTDFDANVAVIAALQELLPPAEAAPPPLPSRPSGGIPLGDFLGVLTEYELSRLKANLRQGKELYAVRFLCSMEALDKDLGQFSAAIKAVGEIISSVPEVSGAVNDGIAFRFLFATAQAPFALEQKLAAVPERVDPCDYPGASEAGNAPPPCAAAPKITYRIRFTSAAGLAESSPEMSRLVSALRRLGPCRVLAQSDYGADSGGDPIAGVTRWDVTLTTDLDPKTIKEPFSGAEGIGDLTIETADDEASGESPKRLGELLVSRGDISCDELEKGLARQRRIGEILVEEGIARPTSVVAALSEQQHIREVRRERREHEAATSIRVPTVKLDHLVNLVGELVTVQARLGQLAEETTETELLPLSEEIDRLVSDLRDSALSIKMLPIGTVFGKLQRVIRDLASERGKEVDLVTSGGETELDKSVVEKLEEPLLQLVGNRIDQGIEARAERTAAGKPSRGTLRITAKQAGDSVEIVVADDGAGEAGDAAGRKGVAEGGSDLEAVTRFVASLRGSVETTSEPGKGTAVTLRIPLALAIVESLLVAIGADRFVVPLAAVEECIELTADDVALRHGRDMAEVRGQIVPYVSLRETFRIAGDAPDIQQILIVDADGERIGFVVDRVIGEHQTVIKSLGKAYGDVPGISGATILGDGTVALILDPRKVMAAATAQLPV